jgi:ribosome-associated heat shock protein Hsp15
MTKVRVDKWLWSVRIFKTRTQATTACKSGKIKINELNLKPSFLLQGGEILAVKKEGFNLSFKVVTLINKRVGAPIAVECYENLTSDEELNKYKSWFIGKGAAERRLKGAGRPTKRERREIDDFKEDQQDEYFDFDI